MSFRRLKNLFGQETWGGVTFKGIDVLLVNGSAHYGKIVKVASSYTKTEYTHIYLNLELLKEINDKTVELPLWEIRRLRHHMTRRIWMRDGVFKCIEWQTKFNIPDVNNCKLLPPIICYECMKEGNKYIPKQLKRYGRGLCRCCGNLDTNLYPIRLGWPVDLRHKGFGFTVIGTGDNFKCNIIYYNHNFDMSIYRDYTGQV